MARVDYQEALVADTIELAGKEILVYTELDVLHEVPQGWHKFPVIQDGLDYTVTDEEGKILLKTEDGNIIKYFQPFNRREQAHYVSEPIHNTENVEKAILEQFLLVAYHLFSFGGGKPYKEVIVDMVIDDMEATPIGEAVVGETFIVA